MAINFRRDLLYWRSHFFDYCRMHAILLLAGNDVVVCNAWFDDHNILRHDQRFKTLIARSNVDILPKL